ncbi:hypothetical protein F5Y15DRAFT_410403 [Xylariaceae sp. FL0016]|nr:hypothetical protein F5Y15DRAFT_410403 [Xylariaceae sp. FL0016]
MALDTLALCFLLLTTSWIGGPGEKDMPSITSRKIGGEAAFGSVWDSPAYRLTSTEPSDHPPPVSLLSVIDSFVFAPSSVQLSSPPPKSFSGSYASIWLCEWHDHDVELTFVVRHALVNLRVSAAWARATWAPGSILSLGCMNGKMHEGVEGMRWKRDMKETEPFLTRRLARKSNELECHS